MSEEKYIPINKGHFELDTPERIASFQERMALGWEEEYRLYRSFWNELPRKREVRDYPLLVDLELSSVCNLRCPMCYTITEEFKSKVKKGFMDFDLYRKIIDEVAGKVYAIRLSFRGEPTLHKQFVEAVTYAKSRGVREVSFLTNGSRLEGEFAREIIKAGADWITISIDGTHAEYENIRRPLKFQDTLRKLEEFKAVKEELGQVRPLIKAQGIWPAIRPDPSRYYNTLAPVTDLLAYNPLIDYLRQDKDIVYEDNFACPQLYQRLVVGSDGRVMMCSNDEDTEVAVGDAYNQTIHDIWHGEAMNRIRDIHNQPEGFLSILVCRLCYYPRKAVPDERSEVNGREIWIENYVNRKQQVGQ